MLKMTLNTCYFWTLKDDLPFEMLLKIVTFEYLQSKFIKGSIRGVLLKKQMTRVYHAGKPV